MTIILMKEGDINVYDIIEEPTNIWELSKMVIYNNTTNQNNNVSLYIHTDYVNNNLYLKTFEPLFNYEFEELFGLNHGQFIKNKIVCVSLNDLQII